MNADNSRRLEKLEQLTDAQAKEVLLQLAGNTLDYIEFNEEWEEKERASWFRHQKKEIEQGRLIEKVNPTWEEYKKTRQECQRVIADIFALAKKVKEG